MSEELTVEEALKELREMFPNNTRLITIADSPHYARPKITVQVGGLSTTYAMLLDCMAIARRWKGLES